MEPAEAGRAQRAVARGGGRAGCEGGDPGCAQRERKRPGDVRAVPALLDVSGEEDDSRIDPVADDDAAEECRVWVQVMDHAAGEREGESEAGEERHRQQRYRADGP